LNKLIIISGPTATGKTGLSIRLAKDLGGEIISADSMQIYKGMDIGTAKASLQERQSIPHHMMDIVDPSQSFSIADYKVKAEECVKEINARGKVPILVGGTCFYIHALLYDTDFNESDGAGELRKELEALSLEHGNHYMHQMLEEIDPESAISIHENNAKRVIGAIEFFRQTGRKISEHNEEARLKDSPYSFKYFALTRNREELFSTIDERVDRMMSEGLLDEVVRLKSLGLNPGTTAMQAIGYKEIIAYLDGLCTLDEAVDSIKRESRKYSKRQETWLKREKDIITVDAPVSEDSYQWILKECMSLLA